MHSVFSVFRPDPARDLRSTKTARMVAFFAGGILAMLVIVTVVEEYRVAAVETASARGLSD